MLNVFPNLLTYVLAAPFILRIVLSIFIILRAYKALKEPTPPQTTEINPSGVARLSKIFAGIYIIVGIALFVGIFTQLAALVVIILTLITLGYQRTLKTLTEQQTIIYVFVLAIALSLMFTGAGSPAIDLPL